MVIIYTMDINQGQPWKLIMGPNHKLFKDCNFFKEWECYDMEPKNDKDWSWLYWILAGVATLVFVSVIVTTVIFFLRKKRNTMLAFDDENVHPAPSNGNPFIEDNLESPVSSRDPEFFNENINDATSGGNVGNLENSGGQSLFSIYCRSCYRIIENRRQNTQSLSLNCFKQNSNHQDEKGILQNVEEEI